jgi:hypothetical protein
MYFFQCLGVVVLVEADLTIRETGSLGSGGEGREDTLPGEIDEATSSESATTNGPCFYFVELVSTFS